MSLWVYMCPALSWMKRVPVRKKLISGAVDGTSCFPLAVFVCCGFCDVCYIFIPATCTTGLLTMYYYVSTVLYHSCHWAHDAIPFKPIYVFLARVVVYSICCQTGGNSTARYSSVVQPRKQTSNRNNAHSVDNLTICAIAQKSIKPRTCSWSTYRLLTDFHFSVGGWDVGICLVVVYKVKSSNRGGVWSTAASRKDRQTGGQQERGSMNARALE